MRKTLRIFISSPGDVQEERLRAHLVIQKLARDYQRFFKIEPYLWEYEPMLASGHFQDAIEPPSASDVVVLVVYSRLGTPLPEQTKAREYHGIDGRVPVTGTEWEFEEALEAHQSRGAPDLLAYRKLGDPQASLADSGKRAEQERQWQSLEGFWKRHFEGGGVFLAGSAKFRTLEEFDGKLEADLVRLIEGKIAEGLRGEAGIEEATWLQGSPFQGLAAYDFADWPIFFGRDAQIREASTRLQAAAGSGTAFLLVLGASGSGKSSLARAGILPALFAAKAVPNVGVWRRAVLRPGEGGEDPVLGLARALVAGDPANGEGLPELLGPGMGPEALAAHLQSSADDPSFPFRQALGQVAQAARAKGLLPHEEARLVILVDQVEELFTRDLDPARRTLFVRILSGLARSGAVWIVATMRNDLWHRAAETPHLVALVEAGARLDLPAPGGAEIIEIVRRPAAAAGIVFEKDPESGVGLDAVISRAASEEPGALPLLSVMLQSLYGRDIEQTGGRALTFASYRALGELRGAIAERADQALADLARSDPDAPAALPRVLRALVTTGHDGATTSRPARLDAFAPGGPEARLVAAFLAPDTRLLVASEHDGVAEVRLAHEALIENWPRAREQIETDRRDLQTRARLETLHRRWHESGNAAEKTRALLTSLNLAEGTDLVRRWEIPAADPLGAYVAASATAEGWRRRRVAVAALALVLVFAAIAALASLQWRRAERQTVAARAAEETERQAREQADASRVEALRQRDRADGERTRALAALKEARRSAARALSVQSELATDRGEIRRALQLAVTAGDTEADALEPGERSTSEPAMLKALADDRLVIQIDRPKGRGASLPTDFYGSEALVYADPEAGVMLVELPSRRTRRLARLPENTLPLHVRSAPGLGLVVVTSVKNLFVIEVETGRVRAQIEFPERIGALDVDEGSKSAAIGTGSSVTFIDLARPERTGLVPVPAPRPGFLVGQVRFSGAGRRLVVTYGADILQFERDANAFGPPFAADLSVEKAGLGRDLVDRISQTALVELVHLRPDPARDRLLVYSVLNLSSVRPDGTRFEYERDGQDSVLGLDFTGPDGSGDVLAVTGRRLDSGYDIRVAFISEEAKPLLYDAFRVSASDLDNEQLQDCRLSRDEHLLACGYNGKQSQGVFVWHVVGGKHRGARLLTKVTPSVTAAAVTGPTPRMLLGSRDDLFLWPAGQKPAGLAWNAGWRLEGGEGPFVPAVSSAGQVQVFRVAGDVVSAALPPVAGIALDVKADLERALVVGADRVAVYDLRTGRETWSVPGLRNVRAADMRADGEELIAASAEAVYTFDGRTGRLTGSRPLDAKPDTAIAVDVGGRKVVYVSEEGPQLLDLAGGAPKPLAGIVGKATLLRVAVAPGRDRILLALDDGRVVAIDGRGEPAWTIAPPASEGFEVSALPGQEPRGFVRGLVVSPGGRLAIVRQDMLPVSLHDLASGRFLTELTPVWMSGVPSQVSFDREDRIVTSWSLHAMTRGAANAVTLHALPLSREAVFAAARAALEAAVPRLPDGSRRAGTTTAQR